MPGTQVRDTLAPVLQASSSQTATNTTTGVLVNRPGDVEIKMTTGTVSGTSPTIDVEVQASDASAFGSGVVSLGKFAQVSTATQTRYLRAYCSKAYMRLIITVGGSSTPTVNTVVVTVHEPNYQRTRTISA